ncbi:Putative NAD(P)H nitroreductase [Anaerohalosphaera lusitana]|uniref:Putative NAD(P)H nitroreductase n=1 Tax=Anaerohalosphaera lusitana TaxID=1936003 RepID=A0A1U9NQJ8_9BACT|nr:nitroreductase family protein [Anaerohalosphaera lusitana]AQT70202.1 Putative NAD(P)H nitroreductase [Anaerohalosphaera lusitana]
MAFLELAKTRQSVRSYKTDPVEREKLEYCLEAARLAPSACNSQPWQFVVVDEPELKEKVAKACFGKVISFNHFSLKAPAMVVLVAEKPNLTSKIGSVVKKKRFELMDVAIAAEHFCLAAAEQGLGTCMLGWFAEKPVKELLNVPKDRTVELIITVGYPAKEEVRPKKRKSLDEMRSFNTYKS